MRVTAKNENNFRYNKVNKNTKSKNKLQQFRYFCISYLYVQKLSHLNKIKSNLKHKNLLSENT